LQQNPSALDVGTKIVMPDTDSKGKDSVDMIRDSLFSVQVKQPWLYFLLLTSLLMKSKKN
jgi:hypothetical protein